MTTLQKTRTTPWTSLLNTDNSVHGLQNHSSKLFFMLLWPLTLCSLTIDLMLAAASIMSRACPCSALQYRGMQILPYLSNWSILCVLWPSSWQSVTQHSFGWDSDVVLWMKIMLCFCFWTFTLPWVNKFRDSEILTWEKLFITLYRADSLEKDFKWFKTSYLIWPERFQCTVWTLQSCRQHIYSWILQAFVTPVQFS